MPTSADSKKKCAANGSPAIHQTLRQQGGTGEDGYSHLADWTLCVAAIEKKKKLCCFGVQCLEECWHDNFAGFALYQRKAIKGWIMTYCTWLPQTWSK